MTRYSSMRQPPQITFSDAAQAAEAVTIGNSIVASHKALFSSGDSQTVPSPAAAAVASSSLSSSMSSSAGPEPEENQAWSFSRAVVVEPYHARTAGELSLKAQDLIMVLEKGVDDWWIGENGEFGGLFPAHVRDCPIVGSNSLSNVRSHSRVNANVNVYSVSRSCMSLICSRASRASDTRASKVWPPRTTGSCC